MELADNLVDRYDVIEVLTLLSDRCVAVIDVSAAGVMLAQPDGVLQFVASSNESMRILELFQVQASEGPCMEVFTNGSALVNHMLHASGDRWPHFTPRALAQGVKTIHCLPMRLRTTTIGGLNLFHTDPQELSEGDQAVAQGLADMATIAILQHRTSNDAKVLTDQLGIALESRIVIEQAKGKIAQDADCEMEAAFSRLRAYARNHNLRLTEVAQEIVDGSLGVAKVNVPSDQQVR